MGPVKYSGLCSWPESGSRSGQKAGAFGEARETIIREKKVPEHQQILIFYGRIGHSHAPPHTMPH